MKKIFYILSALSLPAFLFAAPANPSNLKLVALSGDSVSLSWLDNSDDETGFKIFRDDILIATTASNIPTFIDTGLTPNSTYRYTIKATDDVATPPASNELVWYDEEPKSLTYDLAVNYCESLDVDGFTNWRLPEIVELLALSNYQVAVGEDMRNPDLDNIKEEHYWSNTLAGIDFFDKPQSWVANLVSPSAYKVSKTSSYNVLCVRGAVVSEEDRFTRVNGIVYDKKTKLQWQDEYISGKIDSVGAQQATNYCDGININGEIGWRIPNVAELLSIVNIDENHGRYFDIFETTQEHKSYYTLTSGTTSGGDKQNHWMISIHEGNYNFSLYHHFCPEGSDTVANIRCVKEQP
jgi:hypothetical protein